MISTFFFSVVSLKLYDSQFILIHFQQFQPLLDYLYQFSAVFDVSCFVVLVDDDDDNDVDRGSAVEKNKI